MTMTERQEIFAKEYLSIDDLVKLYDLTASHASEMLNDMKRKLTIGKGQELRLNVRGRIHVQDYLDYFGIKENRYTIEKEVL